MNYSARIKLLLSVPTYRVRLAFFVVLGGAIFLSAFLVSDIFWKDILLQFAIVFIGVGLIETIWSLLGGDAMELQMTRSFGDIDSKLDSIHRSMTILADIIDCNIGIERIWPDRRTWEKDSVEGLATWKKRVCHAQKVDIVSMTLWTRWFHDDAFRKEFFTGLAHGTTARILIYDPQSNVVKMRIKDEKDPRAGRQMREEINSTLEKMFQEREKMDDTTKKNLQVRLTTEHYHLAQIIR